MVTSVPTRAARRNTHVPIGTAPPIGLALARTMKHRVYVRDSRSTLQIPCPDEAAARTVQQVIAVDKELRPHDVHKEMRVETDSEGAAALHLYAPLTHAARCTQRHCGTSASRSTHSSKMPRSSSARCRPSKRRKPRSQRATGRSSRARRASLANVCSQGAGRRACITVRAACARATARAEIHCRPAARPARRLLAPCPPSGSSCPCTLGSL